MTMTEDTAAKPPWTPWYKGMPVSPNPRGRGHSPSKFSKRFLTSLSASWELHGDAVLEQVREKDPTQYLRSCASLIPRQIMIHSTSTTAVAQMSEQELQAVIVEDVTALEKLRTTLLPLVERVAAHDPALADEMHCVLDG